MSQPFKVMSDLLLPSLPGADTPIVDASIRKGVREFMKRTTLYRETFAFDTVPGTDRYQLLAQTGQVSAVVHVYEAGKPHPLPVATEEMRRVLLPRVGLAWWSPLPTVLALYPTPDEVVSLTVEAAVTLPQDAVEIPDGLFDNYGEVVASGILSIMYAMPGKPWTSEKAATVAGRAFSQEIKTLRGRLRDGGQPNQTVFTPLARFGV